MNPIIQSYESKFGQFIQQLNEQLSRLRTGRANVSLVENLLVEAYGVRTPLKQLASINVPDTRTIVIQPWDKNIITDVEKAIQLSDIGINPINEGEIIRINIPSLTEERRKEIVRILHQRLENIRIAIRNLRDEIRRKIFDMELNKGITEDDKYLALEELDNIVDDYMREIKKIGDNKEEEIMTL